MLKKKLEVFAVKLYQDPDAPGPRLRPGEEYTHSWVNKDGNVISHNYQRDKKSPDDLLPMPRHKILGIRPPAKEGEHQNKSEKKELSLAVGADARLDISQSRLRSELKDIHKDFSAFQEYFEEKMDTLASALGILGDLD